MRNQTVIEKRPPGLRTWIEINTDALRHNIASVRQFLPKDVSLMAVVKSNAYGHGLFDYSSFASSLANSGDARGIDWLGVDSIVEAVSLRGRGVTLPILVLGYTLPELLSRAAELGISLTVSSMDALLHVIAFGASSTAGTVPKVQIKIDTGLNRQGFLPEEISSVIETLVRAKAAGSKVGIEGIFSHMADAKRPAGEGYSLEQLKKFETVKEAFSKAGFNSLSHIVASPGLLRFGANAGQGNLVRIGALLYGIWPAASMKDEFNKKISMSPALSWKTVITELKRLPKGATIGYDRTHVLTRDTVVGICPIGYWHGYPTSLSSTGTVLVGEKKTSARVLGRVSMDMITIDCTDCADPHELDVVTLIDAGEGAASAFEIAATAGVSVHELLTRLNPKIHRIYK